MDFSNQEHGSNKENDDKSGDSVQLPVSEQPPIDSTSQQLVESISTDSSKPHNTHDDNAENVPHIDVDIYPLPVQDLDDGRNDVHDQDPNTSITLHAPEPGHLFTTPLKLLPPLKDIESITTPKSFSVAKDSISEQVESSPVVHHRSTQLENLAEAEEDAFDSVANDTFASTTEPETRKDDPLSSKAAEYLAGATFIGVEPSELFSLSSEVVSKIAHRAQQYQGILSELSFFKLNQELINQVQQKKFDMFQKKVEKLTSANDALTAENDKLSAEADLKEDLVKCLRNQVSSLTDKANKLETTAGEKESSYTERIGIKDQEIFRLNDSLNKLTKASVDSGQRLSEITKELNEVTNEKFTFKLELSKVANELSYVKNQKDWYEQELKSIQDKYTELIKKHDSDYLKDSNKISSLVSKTDTLTSLNEALKAQVKTLQEKFEQESTKSLELESKFEVQSIKFARESSAKDDMIELLNLQVSERSDRITQLEDYAEELKSSTAESIGALQKELSDKVEKIILLEERLRRTEDALDSELHKETELPKLAQSAELIMQNSPLGISLSTLYTEFNHVKKELALERSQKEKLADQLQHFVSELESKKPAIANYRNQIQFYEQSMKDMLGKLESVRIEKLESEKESNRLRTRLASYETELLSMKQLSKDLGRQLCYYLIHSKIREGNEDPLTSNEKRVIDLILARSGNKDMSMETDTDQLITERLVNFASVIEMQKQNEELLLAIRQLGKQLEDKEHETNGFEVAAVEEAREAILTLQGELDSITIKLEAVTKERDLMKSLNGGDVTNENNKIDYSSFNTANKELKATIAEKETASREFQAQSAEKIKKLNEKLTVANNAKEELQLKLSSAKHSVEMSESRLENSKKSLDNIRTDLDYFKKEATFWKEQASKQESLLVKKSNELRDAERSLVAANASTKNLSTEKEVWAALHLSLKDEIAHLKKDKEHLNSFVFNLQSLIKERESASLELSNRLAGSVQNYQALQDKIAEKEERILILASQSELALKAQNTKLEQVKELSQKLLDAKSKLAEKQSLIDGLRRKLADSAAAPTPSLQPSTVTSNSHFGHESDILPSEYEDIKNDLKLAESQVTEFSNIAKAAEDALMKATEVFDQFKITSDEKIHSLEAERNELASKVSTYKRNVEDLQSQLYETENKYMNEIQELKAKVHEYSLKAGSYDNLRKDYESKIATINCDLQSQMNINNELESNYRAKLAETEKLITDITKEKEANSSLRTELGNVSSKLRTIEADLKTKEDILAEQESGKQEELAAAQMKIKDLEYQYNLALNQLELNTSGASTTDTDGTEDLREVVHFLRREKDGAEAKVASLTDEQSRLKTQIETVTSELNASRSQLSRIQMMKMQLDDATKDHSRMIEQLEHLNILRESNTTLRNENQLAQERIAQLQAEIELIKAQPAAPATSDDSEIAVQMQELKLLKEENERLKTQLTNNEEVKNLMQRFENLKNEFKTKLMGHRNKNKELEKQLAEVKTSLEEATKQANEKDKVASEKAAREKNFNEEINKLKAAFETEKTNLANTLKSQYEQSLQKELETAKLSSASSVSIDAVKQQVEKEWISKMEASNKELTAKFAKELESKVLQQVSQRLAQNPAQGQNIEEARKSIAQEYEKKIKQLNEDFDKRLAQELKAVEKTVDKKYEFKLRVLNRKVERLEKELLEKQPSPSLGNNDNLNPNTNDPKIANDGNQATGGQSELISTNRRGAVNQTNDKKRPIGNSQAPVNKKAKE